MSIRARGSGQRDPPHWRNHVFSDLVSAPAEGHIVKLVTMPEDGGDWRRGYYGQQRWLATKPKKGTRSTMMLRFDVQHDHDIEDAEHMIVGAKFLPEPKCKGLCVIFFFVSELVSKKWSGCNQNFKLEMHGWTRDRECWSCRSTGHYSEEEIPCTPPCFL